MANPISPEMKTGTIGELLVQLRLLQYGVQAAPPIRDSGNDLIAIKGKVCKSVQIKTRKGDTYSKPNGKKVYDILAVVRLEGEDLQLYLDSSKVFLIPKDKLYGLSLKIDKLEEFEISTERVSDLFS